MLVTNNGRCISIIDAVHVLKNKNATSSREHMQKGAHVGKTKNTIKKYVFGSNRKYVVVHFFVLFSPYSPLDAKVYY